MSRYVATHQKAFWVAGDIGSDNHGERDGHIKVAELGVGYNIGPAQLNLAIGNTWAAQHLIDNGDIAAEGKYAMLESIIPLFTQREIYATFGAYYLHNRVDINRGYVDGGDQEYSAAIPSSTAFGGRARVDWQNIITWDKTAFNAYADFYYSHNTLDAYTETGGTSPAQFNKRKDDITEIRAGINTSTALALTHFDFVTDIEGVHRLNDKAPSSSGQILDTGLSFSLSGQTYQSNWIKAGIGLEGKVGKGKISAMINGTTRSEKSDVWSAISYTLTF